MAIMELRHLRYFVAVAEERSLTVAAKRRLHTAQPSLSRQIRDLESEVGTALITRTARGIELTAAGHAFLDHARLALGQVEAAGEAARRAAQPDRRTLALGFLSGFELEWLPAAMQVLQDQVPEIELTVVSDYSPRLADALKKGKVDAAILRLEEDTPDLAYKLLVKEPLTVVLPSDHRLAARDEIEPQDIVSERLIGMSHTAPVLQRITQEFLDRYSIDLVPSHEVDYLSMAISLIASTRGVALLPSYARNFLPRSVISRPIKGKAPTIDLVLGYRTTNTSPLLKLLLSKVDEMIACVAKGSGGQVTLPP